MKNWLLTPFLLLTLVSCNDQVHSSKDGKNKTNTVTRSPSCPANPDDGSDNPGNEDCSRSPYTFGGATYIDQIGEKQITIHWTDIPEAAQYNIFALDGDGKEIFFRSVTNHNDSAVVKGLSPDLHYKFKVHMMDENGNVDNNSTVLSVHTLAHEVYNNQKSVALNGAKSIQLDESKKLFPNRDEFTVSTWFKMNLTQSESYLFSAHYGVAAGITFAMGIDQNNVIIDYRTDSGVLKRSTFGTVLNDGSWHQLVLTYDSGTLKAYIDGILRQTMNDYVLSFGSFSSYIASYNGASKFFAGNIDEVAIWSQALAQPLITTIYNGGTPSDLALHPANGSLKAWWRLGDLSDTNTVFQDQVADHNGAGIGIQAADLVNDVP